MYPLIKTYFFAIGAGDVDMTSRQFSPQSSNRVSPHDARSDASSPGTASPVEVFPVTSSYESNLASMKMAAALVSQQSSGKTVVNDAFLTHERG